MRLLALSLPINTLEYISNTVVVSLGIAEKLSVDK